MIRSGSMSSMLTKSGSYSMLASIETELREPCVLFNPNSMLRACWDTGMLFIIAYTIAAVPIRIAFKFHLWPLEFVIDFFFLVDLILNFETGYSFRGFIVMERRKVRTRYLKTWFAVDLISSIPTELMLRNLRFTNPGWKLAFRLAPAIKMFRLPRLFRYTMRWRESLPVSGAVLRVCFLLTLGLIFAHWNSCQLFFIAELEGFPEDSWIVRSGLVDEPALTQYANCLMVSISHMTGQGVETGQFVASTLSEIWACILSVTIGVTFYTCLLGVITSMIHSRDREADETDKALDKWARFCRVHNMPSTLQKQGFSHLYEKPAKKQRGDMAVVRELRADLREQVIHRLKLNALRSNVIFKGCKNEVMEALAHRLHESSFYSGEPIVFAGDVVEAMYFVTQGEVEGSTLDGNAPRQLIHRGDTFGDECVLIEMQRIHHDDSTPHGFEIIGSFSHCLTNPSQESGEGSTWQHQDEQLPPTWAYNLVASEETCCYVMTRLSFLEVMNDSVHAVSSPSTSSLPVPLRTSPKQASRFFPYTSPRT